MLAIRDPLNHRLPARPPNHWAILAVNVLLGTTGIGWAGALIWALHAVHRSAKTVGSNGGASGLHLFANDARWACLSEAQGRHKVEAVRP